MRISPADLPARISSPPRPRMGSWLHARLFELSFCLFVGMVFGTAILAEEHAHRGPLPLSMVLGVYGSVVGLLVLGTAIWAYVDLGISERSRRYAAERRSREHLSAARSSLAALQEVVASRLSSPLVRLDLPLLFDASDPVTARWVELDAEAVVLAALEAPSAAEVDRLVLVMEAAWDAWDAAVVRASRVGVSHFPLSVRFRVLRGRRLLRTASDAAVSPARRRAAYLRAVSVLEGVVDLPVSAFVALEASLPAAVLSPALPFADLALLRRERQLA